MNKRTCIHWGTFVLLLIGGSLPAQTGLTVKADDVRVEARADGYHLFVRALPGRQSLLLTEAFELPDHKLATYALRSPDPVPLLKDEPRLLDGKPLKQPHNSLVTSTVTPDEALGPSFHLLIPPVVEFGNRNNPNTRWGQTDVKESLAGPTHNFWFSLRAFAKPYADYTGAYQDNAFELKAFLTQVSVPTTNRYEKGLVEGFSRLGDSYQAEGIQDALKRLNRTLEKPGESLDMVLVIDTTKSMIANLKAVKADLLGPVAEEVKRFKSFRIGLVFYRDYMENYLTQTVGFQSDLNAVQRDLNRAVADGGGDIPEAVVEALWAGVTQFSWKAESRVVLLLGDAPQHPAPRGAITETQLRQVADSKNVEIQLILLPQTAF